MNKQALVGLMALAAFGAYGGTITINFSTSGQFNFTNPGSLTATNLAGQFIVGTGTASNDGVQVQCLTCQMNLTTGVVGAINALDATHTIWLFGTGGTFSLVGTANGITGPTTLVSGLVSSTSTVQRNGTVYSYATSTLTITNINPLLLAFYGEGSAAGGRINATFTGPPLSNCVNLVGVVLAECNFASSSILSGTLQITTAAAEVPEPATFAYAGILLCLAGFLRLKRHRQSS